MDVTSLLNGPPVAVDQPKEGDHWPLSSRSRTPWDAGGYSLPVNNHHKPQQGPVTATYSLPTLNQSSHNDSLQQSPELSSSSHRLSDSRSSLSSFSSASTSNNHSRYSSTSTISGFHPSSNVVDPRSSEEEEPNQGIFSPSDKAKIEQIAISPRGSLSTLASVADNRLKLQIPSDSSRDLTRLPVMRTRSMSGIESPPQENPEMLRPGSPSDAILFKRPSVSAVSGSPGSVGPSEGRRSSNQFGHTLSTPQSASSSGSTSTLRHKRAISAPDFASASGADGHNPRGSVSMGPNAEPTPPSSYHPDRPSPEASWNAPNTAPNTPPEAEVDSAEQPIVCMYIADCNTNSQPRKAISHIFGRNKMCTRLIPQSVWVHFCRKHYQRSRYRNQKEYAKLQCKLIKEQIWRLDRWSESNERKGDGGFVKDWGISIRKREQKRLDDLAETDEKNDVSRPGSEEVEDAGRAEPVPVTAVPEWLLNLCGRGYDTRRIEEIFDRLHAEIENDIIPVFPDIEILPNIVVDREEPKSPKGYAKRKPMAAHKRSQSLGGGALRADSQPPRRMSMMPAWNPSAMYGTASPQQKRKRSIDELDGDFALSPSSQRQRVASLPQEIGRHPSHFPHRPAFSHIQEDFQEDYAYGPESRHREGQAYERGPYDHPQQHRTSNARTPLREPMPQRRQSTAFQLEHRLATPSDPRYDHGPGHAQGQHHATAQEPRRPAHVRSQSDMGAMHHYGFATAYPPPAPQFVLPSQKQSLMPRETFSREVPKETVPMDMPRDRSRDERDMRDTQRGICNPRDPRDFPGEQYARQPQQFFPAHHRHLSTPVATHFAREDYGAPRFVEAYPGMAYHENARLGYASRR